MIRIDQENDTPLNQSENSHLWERIVALLPEMNVVIFEDYDKGVLSKEIIQKVVAECLKIGIPTVVDPKKRNFLFYQHVTLFKPNKKELKEGLKLESALKTAQEIEAAIIDLNNILNCSNILITLSEQGVFAYNQKEKVLIPAHVRSIADVSGAGDTVISVAALCIALKLPLKTLGELSNLSGGLVCEEVGVVPINKEKLLQEALKVGL
jgi:rfaE bifunctional protein kinase chain/domain